MGSKGLIIMFSLSTFYFIISETIPNDFDSIALCGSRNLYNNIVSLLLSTHTIYGKNMIMGKNLLFLGKYFENKSKK